jgi:hypothetical protein
MVGGKNITARPGRQSVPQGLDFSPALAGAGEPGWRRVGAVRSFIDLTCARYAPETNGFRSEVFAIL